MAGDWIKMRSDIYRDPKVSVIAESLMDKGGLLSLYVNQLCQRDMTVTRNVMRNATVGALVSIWGVMRQRGKRCGDDLVCDGVTASVLDDVADMPGIGDAMERAGWVESTENGIAFRRFFEEHNVDPAEKTKASNAARQKRYRDRLKDASTGDVTRDVTVTHREEKNREEKKPPTPKGEQAEPAGFVRFWTSWPKSVRKGGKAKCLQTWWRAKLEPIAEQIVSHVERMAATPDWTKEGGAYVPAPLVYLNQRRWDGAEVGCLHAEQDRWGGAL